MSKDSIFRSNDSYRSDCCAKEAKDIQNDSIFSHEVSNYLPVPCTDNTIMRSPDFQYDHPNLHARIGYGWTDSCTVDKLNDLFNNPEQMTRDRCRTQLFARIFQGCPNLKPGIADSDVEMPILQGTSTSAYEGIQYPCKKSIMEVDYDRNIPLVNCLKDEVQNAEHIVPPWTRGGDPTRQYVQRQDFLKQCGYNDYNNRGGNRQ